MHLVGDKPFVDVCLQVVFAHGYNRSSFENLWTFSLHFLPELDLLKF